MFNQIAMIILIREIVKKFFHMKFTNLNSVWFVMSSHWLLLQTATLMKAPFPREKNNNKTRKEKQNQ